MCVLHFFQISKSIDVALFQDVLHFSSMFALCCISSVFYNEIKKSNEIGIEKIIVDPTKIIVSTYLQSYWIACAFYAEFSRFIYFFFQWRRCFKYMTMRISYTFKPINTRRQ